MGSTPSYIFCGDDFTGASDTLATLARAGLNCRLFLKSEAVLESRELGKLDAAGVATAIRSLSSEDIPPVLQPIIKLLKQAPPRIFHYKVCSTFDSSPVTGSIGTAINTLKQELSASPVLISGGQPSLGRYCIFSNLFAKAPDGIVHRIDRHPTMANHPVTPMDEADLQKFLTRQGLDSVSYIHAPYYQEEFSLIHQKVHRLWESGKAVIFDVQQNTNLQVIGKFLHESRPSPLLAIGSSSVAEAYLTHDQYQGSKNITRSTSTPNKPIFVMAGSRSQTTATQIEKSSGFVKLKVLPSKIETNRLLSLEEIGGECLKMLEEGKHVLVVVDGDMRHSLQKSEIASFTADICARIVFSGLIDRLCIAGGDTSSLAMQRLNIDSISYLSDIEPGLCLCQLHTAGNTLVDGIEIVLKGGQMGSDQFFVKLFGPL